MISAAPSERGVQVTATITAITTGRYEAEMAIQKSGAAGTATTRQTGAFDLSSGESATVATIGLSFDPADELDIRLTVRSEGQIVSKGSLTLNSE